ncbi:hypothetical protein LR48_Vigan09g002500 [Vigna angularis]|uniref:Uncharacterized protein n=1 Tax=Phaseolus angularis TaxID=3914 RepID=A0A0L9V8G9_PHAAN|nr:hypothetical protein LR48_Vigan09g002500 [Vigna angularis]
MEGRVNTLERGASEHKRVIAEWRRSFQELKEMILEYHNQERDSKGREKSLDRARRGGKEEFLHDIKKGKKEVKKCRVARETVIIKEDGVDQDREGNVVTITSGSRVSETATLSVDCFARIRGQDRREENICEQEGQDENCDGDIVCVVVEKVTEATAIRVDNVTNVGRENTSDEDHDGNVVTLASPSKIAKVVVFSGDNVVGRGVYVKTVKMGEDRGKKAECGGNIVTIMSGNRVVDATVLSGEKLIQECKILVSQTYKTPEDQWQGYFFVGLQSNVQIRLPQQNHMTRCDNDWNIDAFGILGFQITEFRIWYTKTTLILTTTQAFKSEIAGSSQWDPFQ